MRNLNKVYIKINGIQLKEKP